MIKKLVLKYLEKYIGNEFTQIDNRIYDIEVKLGIHKPEHDANFKYVGDMAIKDAEHIVDTNQPIINIGNLVEIGTWYKHSDPENLYLICINKKGSGRPIDEYWHYGFDNNGIWYDKYLRMVTKQVLLDNFTLASREEVESALVKEAEKRGFKKTGYKSEICMLLTFNSELNTLGYYDMLPVFKDGEWATVIEEPKAAIEIDWSKPGQIVQGYHDGLPILVTTGCHNVKKNTFQAVTITPRGDSSLKDFKGEYWQRWDKNSFKLYNESITLKND